MLLVLYGIRPKLVASPVLWMHEDVVESPEHVQHPPQSTGRSRDLDVVVVLGHPKGGCRDNGTERDLEGAPA
jgi:hypothetical protein